MATPSGVSPDTGTDWGQFRRQMPVARRWAYLDHAAVAPISGPARDCLLKWTDEITYQGSTPRPAWDDVVFSSPFSRRGHAVVPPA